jgi:predicted alpha/beta hydrolase family esterase
MSPRAIIFHGTGGSPAYCWYRWLEQRLRERGYQVEVPHLPGINTEPIATFLPKVLAGHTIDENTVLIGHSGGAALLLALLEQLPVTVPMAVLVAGYSTPPNEDDEPVLKAEYDWARIRSHVDDIYFVNSADDPYGCDDRQGRALFDRLGGTQIIRPEGHFETPTLELVDRLIP